MTRLLIPFLLLLVSLTIGSQGTANAAETIDREYELKAAYLYNIFKFITWPDKGTSAPPLQLCIIGPDLSNGALLSLDNKPINHSIIKVRQNVNIADVESCTALYFTDNKSYDQLEQLANQGKLLIGEDDNFTAQGGTLTFFIENNRLRFEFNLIAAQQAGIKISSKLLRLARIYNN